MIGSTNSIGKAIPTEFTKVPYFLIINARDEKALKSTAAKYI